MNAYEQAAERYNLASERHGSAETPEQREVTAAEWHAASRALAAMESSPGIPLPEYR